MKGGTDVTDGMLIKYYVEDGDTEAINVLVQRYYDTIHRRFLKHCRDPENARDLSQNLWERIIKSLDKYQDDGKFAEFLMRCATNMLTDYWRRKGVKDKVIDELLSNDHLDPVDTAVDPATDTAKSSELQQQINYLTNTLIPKLPCEQRLIFLLKHESEYWEYGHRLEWHHLASLNGIDEASAWGIFEETRNRLLSSRSANNSPTDISCDAILIFLVWTQAQRPSKELDYTWQYFAKILDIPENTIKTRYRAALKALSKGLTELNKDEQLS